MSNLYYSNINDFNHYNNNCMSRLIYFHKNNKFHKSQENQRERIMNELFLSNPDLLDNFQRRYSKTPCRLRMKSSFSSKNHILNSTKYTNLRIKMNRSVSGKRNQNEKKDKIKKNLRQNNTTPLMKHINQKKKNQKSLKNQKKKNQKNQKKRNLKNLKNQKKLKKYLEEKK